MRGLLAVALLVGGWHVRTAAPVVAAPLLTPAGIFVGDTSGEIYTLDPATGRVRTRARLSNGMWSTPYVDGTLVIATEGSPEYLSYDPPSYALAGGGINSLVALDPADGTVAWRYGIAGSGASGAAIADGLAIYHDGAGEVVARDARSGAYRWRRFVASTTTLAGVLPIGAGRVALSGAFPNAVYILRARDGAVEHRTALPRDALALAEEPLAYGDGLIFGGYVISDGGRQRAHLYAIDAANGTLRWDRETESGRLALPSRPVFANGMLFVGSPFAPKLSAFVPRDGSRRWTSALPATSLGGVLVRGNTLYAADASGTLTALDARSGAFVGSARVNAAFAASMPVAARDCVIIGSSSGSVWCVPYERVTKASR